MCFGEICENYTECFKTVGSEAYRVFRDRMKKVPMNEVCKILLNEQ